MNNQQIIYHITTEKEWQEAQQKGWYEAPSLKLEGFIHCSTEAQVEGVLQRYYAGRSNLVKLVIDPSLLKNAHKYEMAPSVNELFPHVYGVINLEAITNVILI